VRVNKGAREWVRVREVRMREVRAQVRYTSARIRGKKMRTEKKQVSNAEEGAPSTNAAAGGQAGNVVATSRDQGRSRVD
jgi:hypothetical protein